MICSGSDWRIWQAGSDRLDFARADLLIFRTEFSGGIAGSRDVKQFRDLLGSGLGFGSMRNGVRYAIAFSPDRWWTRALARLVESEGNLLCVVVMFSFGVLAPDSSG